MRVGIVLNYVRHDSTYAALRTAEVIRDLGYGVLFFDKATKSNKANLHAYWDDFVQSSADADFSSWVAECQTVIFFTYPEPKDLKVIKKRKIKSICVTTWDSIDSETITTAKTCDFLVCPSKVQSEYFKTYWNLENVQHVIFHANIPTANNERKATDSVRIICSCPGYQLKRVDYNKLFEALNDALELCPKINMSFIYSSKVASQLRLNIKKQEKTFSSGNKLDLIEDNSGWSETPLAYSLADAVLWPAQLESFGYVGMESLTVGTPVIAYNHPPMSELVSDRFNGILMPCEVRQTELGVTYVDHNHSKIVEVLRLIDGDPKLIHELKNKGHAAMEALKEKFEVFWHNLLLNVLS